MGSFEEVYTLPEVGQYALDEVGASGSKTAVGMHETDVLNANPIRNRGESFGHGFRSLDILFPDRRNGDDSSPELLSVVLEKGAVEEPEIAFLLTGREAMAEHLDVLESCELLKDRLPSQPSANMNRAEFAWIAFEDLVDKLNPVLQISESLREERLVYLDERLGLRQWLHDLL